MKSTNIIVIAAIVALTSIFYKADAQAWVQGGNTVPKDTTLGTKNAFALKIITNNTERMRVTSAGKIGIGTTNPAAFLQVQNTGVTEIARFAGAAGVRLNIYEQSANRGYFGSVAGGVSDIDMGTDGGNTSGSLHLTIKTVPKLTITTAGNVGIGTTTPNASALLELQSTAGGLLVSRMNELQRNAIPSPATGLLIYQTDNIPGFYYYNGGAWKPVGTSNASDAKDNTLLGNGAGANITTGLENVAIGSYALNQVQSGSGNVAVGKGALFLSSATGNTAVGDQVMVNNTTGYQSCAFGYEALFANTVGFNNSAFGYKSLYNNNGTGFNGIWNSAFGALSLYSNTTGSYNSAFGTAALNSNTSGLANTAMGSSALHNNTSGQHNNAFGDNALNSNTTGSWNTALGSSALSSNTAQDKNTAVGWIAGDGVQSAASTYLGFNAHASVVVSGSMALGINATVTASNQVRIATNAIQSIGGYVNWSNISDGRVKKNIKQNVPGLAFINKLIPVTYNLDLDAADKILQTRTTLNDKTGNSISFSPEELAARKIKQQIVYSGFIAQDVERIAKQLGYDFSGIDAAKNDKDLYGLRYAEFVVPLVKAVQELSRQNDEKDKLIDELSNKIKSMEQKLDMLLQQKNISSAVVQPKTIYNTATLDQNVPNPFNKTTIIKYAIPASVNTAAVNIYNTNGALLKAITITQKGPGQVSLNASELPAGTYYYSLVTDGTKTGSKKMIVVK